MRRLFAAIMLVAATAALSACGGGTTATDGAAITITAPPSTSYSSNSSDTLSPNEVVLNEQFPTSQESVPAEILAKLRDKRPMLILYVDSTQVVYGDQMDEVDAVLEKYRGLIDLITYDVAGGVASAETTPSADLRKAMTLAGSVNVKHTPYMLFIDRWGRVIGRFSGYTDRTLLEREVLRATS